MFETFGLLRPGGVFAETVFSDGDLRSGGVGFPRVLPATPSQGTRTATNPDSGFGDHREEV